MLQRVLQLRQIAYHFKRLNLGVRQIILISLMYNISHDEEGRDLFLFTGI